MKILDIRVNSIKEFQTTFEQFGFHFQSFPIEQGKFHARIRIALLGHHIFFEWETKLSIGCVGEPCKDFMTLSFLEPAVGAVGTLTTLGETIDGNWICGLAQHRAGELNFVLPRGRYLFALIPPVGLRERFMANAGEVAAMTWDDQNCRLLTPGAHAKLKNLVEQRLFAPGMDENGCSAEVLEQCFCEALLAHMTAPQLQPELLKNQDLILSFTREFIKRDDFRPVKLEDILATVNSSKGPLRRACKEAFGIKSPLKILKLHRLAQASELLINPELRSQYKELGRKASCKAVGEFVGWKSRPQFSAAYSEQFCNPPSECYVA